MPTPNALIALGHIYKAAYKSMADPTVSLVHVVRQPSVHSEHPPLIVLLHGVGSNEHDLFGLAPFLDGRFVVASVRAPLTVGPDAYGWYPIWMSANGIEHDADGARQGREIALGAINELAELYDVAADRVYVMGFSQGAVTALGIALMAPEIVAGAVIMSGHLLKDVAAYAASATRLNGLPIFVSHGVYDNVLPIESGRLIEKYLKGTTAALTYKEYPMAHTVSEDSLRDIATWLTEQLDGPK